MSIQERLPQPTFAASPTELSAEIVNSQEVVVARTLAHNAVLRALMDEPFITADASSEPGNYETARDLGITDAFYFDPETGDDAIVHILSGDVREDPNTGALEVGGYHHESSALHPETHVDNERIAQKKDKREFRQHPFEPYQKYPVIEGYPKQVIRRKSATEVESVHSRSTLFPREYDGFTVLRILKNARDEVEQQGSYEVGRGGVLVADVQAPLLDGESTMGVRLILEPETKKIMAALPQSTTGRSIMNLAPGEISRHLGLDDPHQ